uniref:C2H2-type domain-containing protein n=1 Tax=Anopheles atroparvus TaxID=41427 RepID=A0AAG5DMY3_ANOAO
MENFETLQNVKLEPCTSVDYDPLATGFMESIKIEHVKIELINGCNDSDDRDAPMYNDRSGDDLTMRDCLVKLESMCTDEIEIGEVKIEAVESDYTEHKEHYTELSRIPCNVLHNAQHSMSVERSEGESTYFKHPASSAAIDCMQSSDPSSSAEAEKQPKMQSFILSIPIEEAKSVVKATKLKWRLLRKRLYNAKMAAKQSSQKHAEELARRRPRYETERFGTDAQGEKQQSKMISLPTDEGTSSDSIVKCSQESMNTTKLEREQKRLQRRLNYAKRVAKQSPQKHAEELARRRARYETERFGSDAQGEKQPSKMISLPTDEGTSSDSIVKCSQEHAEKLARRRALYKRYRDLEKYCIQALEQQKSQSKTISTSTNEGTSNNNMISNMFDKTTRDTMPTYCERQVGSSAINCVQSSDQSSTAQAEKQPKTQSEIISMPIEEATSVEAINTIKLKRERRLLLNHQRYVERVAKQTPQEHAEELARRRARYETQRFGSDAQGEKLPSKMISLSTDEGTSSDSILKCSQEHAEKLARRRERYKKKRDLEKLGIQEQLESYSKTIRTSTDESTSSNNTIELKREWRRCRSHRVAKQSPQQYTEELARCRVPRKKKRDLERSSLRGSANDNMQSSEQSPSVQVEMQHDSESTVVKMPIDKDTNSESSMHAYVECLEIGPASDNTQTSGLIEMDPLDTTKHSYDCQECGKPFTREAKLKSHSCSRKGNVRKQCSVES